MGRMGTHPHVVTIFEIGEEGGAPYVVTELLGGGDVEGMLEKADGTVTLARALQVAKDVCDGLVFAHAQGIVHRDLKPGNVWLTAEGVAKIGDFGLAVNLGRSRLTQHGLMVGTVAYMPPEQALGGEVTPQSDLYSLGAMLYELVTGKPPFQADDPTAVISQHINTPPVAPSWNSDRCPPDLEALILRLLAKVPAARPASAKEVLAALQQVDPDAKSASHSDSSANPLDRLARGVFVGRARELDRLRTAFDNAFAGRGSVVMLVGEPGIGKTRTTQELETYARMRGAKVAWGRAHEASGAPAYYPWTQAGRDYGAQVTSDLFTDQLRNHAVELQRLFPNIRARFPGLPEPPPADSEEAQFALFDAFCAFLRAAALATPLVLVLDDLHWADRPTLRLLTHLAREIASSRLLVVGTYRDTDLDRTHPLSQALAELNREQLFLRVLLRGLTAAETAEYIRTAAGMEPSTDLVRRIHVETEGNPFFLSEIVKLMAEEGAFSSASLSDIRIPEGVKEALGRRLDRLSPEANELLSVASVVGRECTHQLLAALTDFDGDTLLGLIEEALRARVIEETGTAGEYRFTHALMQDALYSELSTVRRVRMHARVAATLERIHAGERDRYAAELAHHFAEAAVMDRALAEQAVRYAELAGQRAETVAAWDEAARWYEQALANLDEAVEPRRAADLWMSLSICFRVLRKRGLGWEAFDRSVALYRRMRDAGAFAAGVARGLEHGTATPAEMAPLRSVLLEALDGLGDDNSPTACFLLSWIAVGDRSATGDAYEERARLAASALGLIGATRPWQLETRALGRLLDRGEYTMCAELAERLHAEMANLNWDDVQARQKWGQGGAGLLWAGMAYLAAGDIDRCEEVALRNMVYLQSDPARNNPLLQIVLITWLRNERARFDQLVADAESDGDGMLMLLRACDALSRGGLSMAERFLPGRGEMGVMPEPGRLITQTRLLLAQDERDAATRVFAEWRQFMEPGRLQGPWEMIREIVAAGDVLLVLGDEALLDSAYRLLNEHGRYKAAGRYWNEGADVLRGNLALRFGNIDAAARHFEEGRSWAARPDVRFGFIEARNLQGLADVAEARGDHALAMQQLDTAGALFAQYGAKLYLDQVLAKKQFLKA